MNILAQTTAISMGLDAWGLASWLRSLARKGATPSELMAQAESLGLHPLSMAVAKDGRGGSCFDVRERNRAFWQWLGGDTTWTSAIQDEGLRLRDAWRGDLPEGLVVPSLEFCRLQHPVHLPSDLQAETLCLYRCPWLERMPCLTGVLHLELIDLPELLELPDGMDLDGLLLGSCPRIETLPDDLKVRSVEVMSCKAFASFPSQLRCEFWRLYALPALSRPPEGLPVSGKRRLRWNDNSGWGNE
jgi:hypothetical protein